MLNRCHQSSISTVLECRSISYSNASISWLSKIPVYTGCYEKNNVICTNAAIVLFCTCIIIWSPPICSWRHQQPNPPFQHPQCAYSCGHGKHAIQGYPGACEREAGHQKCVALQVVDRAAARTESRHSRGPRSIASGFKPRPSRDDIDDECTCCNSHDDYTQPARPHDRGHQARAPWALLPF